MIESISSVADNLLGDFEVISPVDKLEQENKEAEKKLDDFKGLEIHTSDSFAKQMEKEFSGEEEVEDKKDPEDKEVKTEKPEDKKTEDKVDTKKEDKKDEEEVDDTKYSFKGLASYLSEEGIIDFEDSDELADTPEILIESVKKEISNGINSYKESVPEVGKKFLEYLEKGGDESKFYQSLERPIDLDNVDLEDEDTQEVVVREYLKQLGYDASEIDETIEGYKDGLLLEKQSKLASKKLDKIYEKRNESLIKEQEQLIEDNNKKITAYLNNVKETIKSSKSLAGLEVPEKEKGDFTDYLLKVNPKTGLTKYQEDLNVDQVKNSIELAYLKFKKYDFSKAQRKAETKVTQELKNKIFQKSESTVKGKTQDDAAKVDFSGFGMFKNNKK